MRPAGTAWSPIRGVVGHGAICTPGYQAGAPVQSRAEAPGEADYEGAEGPAGRYGTGLRAGTAQ